MTVPATAVLETFPARFDGHWNRGLRAKLGLGDGRLHDPELVDDLPGLLFAQHADFTGFFRGLSAALRGDDAPAATLLDAPEAYAPWAARWRAELGVDGEGDGARGAALAGALDQINPMYIPRNHHVEDALAAATTGDLAPFERLLDVVAHPFAERPGLEEYATAAPASFAGGFRTFCGT